VCLNPRSRVMRGIGERLSEPLDLPKLPAILVHPGVPVATRGVFAALGIAPGERRKDEQLSAEGLTKRDVLLALLSTVGNDLEPAAMTIEPAIGEVAGALRTLSGCRLSRMSGSGSACFGVFDTANAARAGARELAEAHPNWWVRATVLG